MMTTQPAVSLSHFGIHVTDLARMEDFYTRVLGLLVSDRGNLPNGPTLLFLSRDPDEHHQLVLVTGRPPGLDYNVVNQISFKLTTLADLQAMHGRVREEGIKAPTRRAIGSSSSSTRPGTRPSPLPSRSTSRRPSKQS